MVAPDTCGGAVRCGGWVGSRYFSQFRFLAHRDSELTAVFLYEELLVWSATLQALLSSEPPPKLRSQRRHEYVSRNETFAALIIRSARGRVAMGRYFQRLRVVGFTRMGQFVNYKKRGFTLPPGCKNLIDVLHPRDKQNFQHFSERVQRSKVKRDESVTGTLSEVGKFVAMLFESHGLAFTLKMSMPDERLTVQVARMAVTTMWAMVVFQNDTDQERTVRDFFARRGLHAPDDATMTGPFLFPDLPVQILYQISPLPSEAALLSQLVVDLFHDCCGLKDDAALHFHYYEMSDAG